MRILVTGSSGHLGEAIVRTLQSKNINHRSIDIKPSKYTSYVGSITDQSFVKKFDVATKSDNFLCFPLNLRYGRAYCRWLPFYENEFIFNSIQFEIISRNIVPATLLRSAEEVSAIEVK